MKKMIAFVLIAGLLMLGTCAIVGEVSEEMSSQDHFNFTGNSFGDPEKGSETPLGESGPGGGGPEVPG